MRTFGLRQLRHPAVPAAKQDSQSGLQSTQDAEAAFQNVRDGQVMKVPFVEAVVAVTHFVPSLESGWRPLWQVWQVAFGPEHDAQDGSHAVKRSAQLMRRKRADLGWQGSPRHSPDWVW